MMISLHKYEIFHVICPCTSIKILYCTGMHEVDERSLNRRGEIADILLMEEILHQLLGSLSHYLQGFYI